MEWYVNVSSIPFHQLDCIGYYVVHENDFFVLLNNKGEEYVLEKNAVMRLKVDDEELHVLEAKWRIPKWRIPVPARLPN